MKSRGLWWLGLAGFALVMLTLLGAAGHDKGDFSVGTPAQEAAFTLFGCIAVLVYFAATAGVLRHAPPPAALWLILGVALAIRLIVLVEPPFRSSDIFRYVWDGIVQNHGTNPYRYIPADPALQSLRDSAIYPHINRANYAHTIYPPMAQLIFRVVAAINPTVLAMKTAMMGFDLLAIVVMLRLLTLAGIDRARVLIYAWNPLVVWEFTGNGHIDAAAVGFIALALLARARGRAALTGAALGAAILVKFLPAALFPAFWRRWDWGMPLTAIGLIAALYMVFIGAGSRVFGFLTGYANEEGLDSGTGIFWLDAVARFVKLPADAGKLWLGAAVLVLGVLGLWMMLLRDRQPTSHADIVPIARDACVLASAVMVAVTPHYPWYFAWLALPCCLAPIPSVIWLSAAAFLQNHDPFGDYIVQMSCIYVPFVILAVLDIRRHHTMSDRSALAAIPRSS
jgi:alpha-1,6-mannosyltransferase